VALDNPYQTTKEKGLKVDLLKQNKSNSSLTLSTNRKRESIPLKKPPLTDDNEVSKS